MESKGEKDPGKIQMIPQHDHTYAMDWVIQLSSAHNFGPEKAASIRGQWQEHAGVS